MNHEISHDQKYRTHEITTGKNFGPNSYPRKKVLDTRNTQEKNFGSTSYPREKNLDPQNTNEKKVWTHEIPTRKNLMAQWHNDTMAQDPRDPRWHVIHEI